MWFPLEDDKTPTKIVVKLGFPNRTKKWWLDFQGDEISLYWLGF